MKKQHNAGESWQRHEKGRQLRRNLVQKLEKITRLSAGESLLCRPTIFVKNILS
jgi:hypothetical protein